jgi:ribosomal protein S18 acetylase RimI-like enzyme
VRQAFLNIRSDVVPTDRTTCPGMSGMDARRGTYRSPMGSGPVRVRPATGDDLDVCGRLLLEAYGGASAAWHERLAAALAAGELFLVAVRDDDVVGHARAGRRAPDRADDAAPAGWYVTGLVVDPAHRRGGVARRLLADLLAHRPEGEPVWSFVNARNAASLALHRRAGFSEVLRAPRLLGQTFGGGEGVLLRADPAG